MISPAIPPSMLECLKGYIKANSMKLGEVQLGRRNIEIFTNLADQ
jgi:hypothetical protein